MKNIKLMRGLTLSLVSFVLLLTLNIGGQSRLVLGSGGYLTSIISISSDGICLITSS